MPSLRKADTGINPQKKAARTSGGPQARQADKRDHPSSTSPACDFGLKSCHDKNLGSFSA